METDIPHFPWSSGLFSYSGFREYLKVFSMALEVPTKTGVYAIKAHQGQVLR